MIVESMIEDFQDSWSLEAEANLSQHLHRVQEHSNSNRMNAGNLAICFGYGGSLANSLIMMLTSHRPTLMVGGGIPAIADAGWQVRAIDTILQNAFSIFDED